MKEGYPGDETGGTLSMTGGYPVDERRVSSLAMKRGYSGDDTGGKYPVDERGVPCR